MPRTSFPLRASTASLMLLFGIGACGSAPATAEPEPSVRAAADPARGSYSLHDLNQAVPEVADRVVPSVVNIASTKVVRRPEQGFPFEDPFFRYFFGPERHRPQERKQQSLGSGVIVSRDGLVLTNNHVIENADEVIVTTNDRREFTAKVVGTDPPSDLAVLRMENAPRDLQPIRFGDSDTLRVGEVVLAIGNPFGVGQTVTMGIVSAKGRVNIGIVDYEDFIQTDAAINPGNSGGALVSLTGELVGVNTAILSRTGGYMGIGFAIPSNMAQKIMDALIRDGKVTRGFLGVMIQDLTPDIAKALEIDSGRGVLVSDVVPGSPAEKAGIRGGDVILSVEGEAVNSAARLRNKVASLGAGQSASVTILREGRERQLTVRLEERTDGDGQEMRRDEGLLGGASLRSLTPDLRQRFDLPPRLESGVVVTEIAPGGPAASSGLRPGDVIVEVNRRRVSTPEELHEALARSPDRALFRVFRDQGFMYLLVRK